MKRVFTYLLLASVLLGAGNIDKFVSGAKWQVGKTLSYDPEYVGLKFPNGDIDISKGVCTDVVVRALRTLNIDLQERIYNHKKTHPKLYHGLYGTDKLDPNIDHRRVKNIQVYLKSRGYQIKGNFKPGDIVVWKLPGSNLDHIGVCSNKLNAKGEPYIIHNVGAGAKEEDVLRSYNIVDHFRIFKS